MNLDELKDTWSKEEISETPEISIEKQKQIQGPIEKIAKNLKLEFWSTFPVFPLVLYFVFTQIENEKLKAYTIIFVVLAGLVFGYYVLKFYNFYKHIKTKNFSTLEHLLDLEYQMKFYKQLYASYYVAFVPFLLCEFFLIYEFGNTAINFDFTQLLITLVISLFIAFLFFYFVFIIMFNYFYGKHFKAIQRVLQQLKSI